MLFFLTRELWQTVRHFARKSATQSGIWYWNSDDFGEEMLVHSHEEDRPLSSVIQSAVETSRERISVIVATPDLTEEFEQVVDCVVKFPGNLRISIILTSRLDEVRLERCREFIRRNSHLESSVSTFVLASRIDSELNPLEPEDVTEDFRSFLLLLCGGREALAESLGLFRSPVDYDVNGVDDVELEDALPSFRETGIVAVLGVQSWIPKKQTIVHLTQELLAAQVAAEEQVVAPKIRSRITPPTEIIDRALHLSESEEPLSLEHFTGEVPPPPESPVETWRVPVSTRRARKERRHLRRVVQQDFANYTASLEAILDNIRGWLHQKCEAAFAQAEQTYRTEVFEDVSLGSLSYLLREYYPTYGGGTDPDEFSEGPTGWPPDESQDCFADVYEALEEGLEELPSGQTWAKVGAVSLALLAAAWVFRDAEWFIFFALVMASVICPAALLIHRTVRLNELRRQVVQLSDGIYANLRRNYYAEIERVLLHARMDLERRIRDGATGFGENLRHEFESIPLLSTKPEIDWDNLPDEIARLKNELIGVGIDETRFERLASRMGRLARTIVEAAGGALPTGAEPAAEMKPKELVEEWFDELVGSSVLPLEKVKGLQDEILEVASTWRMPPLMAPLTDAELHRGFRKVVVVPNSDIVYHHLQEALPRYSGNPVVNLKVWSGPVPGVAICSLMVGLPDSVLESQSMQHQVKAQDAV